MHLFNYLYGYKSKDLNCRAMGGVWLEIVILRIKIAFWVPLGLPGRPIAT
jgi:hypothetical protein